MPLGTTFAADPSTMLATCSDNPAVGYGEGKGEMKTAAQVLVGLPESGWVDDFRTAVETHPVSLELQQLT